MDIKISEETVKNTTKCPRNFKCLTDGRDMCPVDKTSGKVLFLKENGYKNRDCPYLISFGFTSYICTCPTRYEIYTHYKI